MRTKIKRYQAKKFGTSAGRSPGRDGSVLVLVVVSMIILVLLGLGMLGVAYGVRHRAIRLKNETTAMMAAEAGYEEAIFWMSQQLDMLTALQQNASGTNGALSVADGSCDYQIKLFAFVGSRPIYRVVSNGRSGVFKRTVDVYVVQALSGWDMGMCRVPFGGTQTYPVNFADGEIIDMRVHINDLEDSPDERDIYISGEPRFLELVTMGESKYTDGGGDKRGYNDNRDYDDLMHLFEGGIYFNQPDCRITDEKTVQRKLDRFRASTDDDYNFSDDTGKKPVATALVGQPGNRHPAVQLEFFVEGGVGKVRITNNCTVLGYQRDSNSKTLDFKIKQDTDGEESERYDIYAYHFRADNSSDIKTEKISKTYVSQVFGEFESEPGGQIFVDGSVVIGGHEGGYGTGGDQVIKGTMTIVATGNIWVADSIRVDGPHDASGMPSEDNPNILGLISQGVVKVIDPGMSGYAEGNPNYYPGPPPSVSGHVYAPVAHPETYPGAATYDRYLSDQMVVEAAITVGGGGWGAENVEWNDYGGRKEDSPPQDDLIVRGAIIECMRGVVGRVRTYYYSGDGFIKHYYMDERILEGILPGDIWLRGKYVPAPSGWHDYRH